MLSKCFVSAGYGIYFNYKCNNAVQNLPIILNRKLSLPNRNTDYFALCPQRKERIVFKKNKYYRITKNILKNRYV